MNKAGRWIFILVAASLMIVPIAMVYSCPECNYSPASPCVCHSYLNGWAAIGPAHLSLTVLLPAIPYAAVAGEAAAPNPISKIFKPPRNAGPLFV